MEKNIVLFIMTFLVLIIIYEFMIFRSYKRSKKKKKKSTKNNDLIEIMLLKNFFKVPVEKFKHKWLFQVIALVSSIDIALIVTIACVITEIGILQLLISFVIMIPIIFISYYIVSFFCFKILKRRSLKDE